MAYVKQVTFKNLEELKTLAMKNFITINNKEAGTIKQSGIAKEKLYNLLFNGRITLKEYLALLKTAGNS